ncbi:cytochrome b561 and DOMON domain-containing protein [Trifolium repens]|nr:cytochrome b561 and DOMON domain-containing protein [Trifolium repens]
MKMAYLCLLIFLILLCCSSILVSSQDSCASNLAELQQPIPFDTKSLLCSPVWADHNFILRYAKVSTDVWGFILSFPTNIRTYAAIGFSKDGKMIGSTAIVGWMPSSSEGGMKMYSLDRKSTKKVIPDKGELYMMNASIVPASTSLGYMIFQLKATQLTTKLLFAIGPNGVFPNYPNYALSKHSDQISLVIDYSKGTIREISNLKLKRSHGIRKISNLKLRRSHGIINIAAWSILMIIGSIIARYFKQWDPIWFYIFGFLAGIVGIFCGIVLSKKLDSNVTHHKNIAILIVVLGCLQVLAIKLRPGKDSRIRGEGSKWFLAYGVSIAILVIFAFILEIRKWIIVRKETNSTKIPSFPQSNVDSSILVTSQDSCASNLVELQQPIPFDTKSLLCSPVWADHNFILRYAKASSDVWSFIFSFPINIKAYAAIGFSKDGNMVGSTAIVGWMPSPGAGVPASTSLGYMIFQLKATQLTTKLLFAIGPNGVFPDYPDYALSKHSGQISLVIDYSKGTIREISNLKLRRSHGIINIAAWSILMIIGSIIARYFKQWDPIWFYLHASIQIFGFLAGIVGIFCGLVLSKKLESNVTHHKNIAILIVVLGCLQVLAIKLRPGKDSRIRKYWNWYHHNIGRILICFAVANTFYGLHLGGEGSKWFLAYGVSIAILVIFAFILEIRKWIIVRKETNSTKIPSFPQSNVELAY